VTNQREKGMALITALLVLLLMSTMIVGLSWLVMSDQKLGGSNSDRQLAFYGAEAGMEQLTASLENLFDSNYAPTLAQIGALEANPGPPTDVPGVQYLAPGSTANGSGYVISAAPSAANASVPASSYSTIPTGSYAGLVGLMTPYTLEVTAHTAYGSEVKLQRQVQTVAIPVFQFGIFSDMDLSFFAGPNFDFGGRVHTNGNLWLAEGNGATLTMSNKVTAVGNIITSNLENGWNTSSNYTGVVDITTGSGFADLKKQSPSQSVTGTNNYFGNVSSYNSSFASVASGVYNGNIAVGSTGATKLDLSIATPAIGGQPIDLIRRPVKGEDASSPAKLSERYYSQVSLRILLSDYGPSGTCSDSDISSTSASAIPDLSANGTNPTTPVDLATLAWDSSATAGSGAPPYNSAPSWITATNVGKTIFPLPVSGATSGSYNSTNGYWVKQYYPIITGCIKIDYQSKTSPGTWVDVTGEILNLGWTGRDIDPQVGKNGVPSWVAPPSEPNLNSITGQVAASGPTANSGVTTVGCTDPSPDAVIRLARVRDNPSNAVTGNNYCGNNPSTGSWSGKSSQSAKCWVSVSGTNCSTQHGTDYWPNAIFDTREGTLRDVALSGDQVTLAGSMYYVELDVSNLARWFTGAIGASGTNADNTTGYSVYFSDRRGDMADPNPPASVGTAAQLTGGFGYDDFVNSSSSSGCPNGVLDQGEDVESDYSGGVSENTSGSPRTYGGTPAFDNYGSPSVTPITALTSSGVLNSNPNCGGTSWPFAVAKQAQDLRENPATLYRRALKIVDGDTISMGTCNSVPCGLTLVAENPVYVQGDYNNPGLSTSFSGTGVAASVIGDAVTLLSDSWNDVNSFASPYSPGNRTGVTTTYRMAVVGGKGVPFKQPTVGSTPQDFGTDGGTHNFLRYLESWSSLYYRGSIVNMYYNHQAVGVYKCCTTVYGAPTRNYQFDTNFLTPSLLPPLTPMLRTINTIGFTQTILPTQ
jgi:PilX N-terminal